MLPQTELDNYKLQVELLQEKLRRSEEQRQHLEEKFENLMKKRYEEEQKIKNIRKIKYQQFMEVLKERNERNKMLLKSLEYVDQQAAVLAARTERYKMMKVQHELHLAKLLQAEANRSAQETTKYYTILPTPHILSPNPCAPFTPVAQDIYQTNNNSVKNLISSSPLAENWSVINNTSNLGRSIPHRIPSLYAARDDLNGQVLVHHELLTAARQPVNAKQINLKSKIADDSIILQHNSPPIQFDTTDNLECNRNNLKYYNMNSSELGIRVLPSTNSINIQNSYLQDERNNSSQKDEIKSKDGINEFRNFNQKYYQNQNIEEENPENDVNYSESMANKLSYTSNSRDGNFSTEMSKNYNEKYIRENNLEKSQPKNIVNNNIDDDTQLNNNRQKIDKIDEEGAVLTHHEKLFENKTEKSILKNLIPSRNANDVLDTASHHQKPDLWNFSGRIDRNISSTFASSDIPIKLGKKEKLSIENIENVIYGEKINPIVDSEKLDFKGRHKEHILTSESILNVNDNSNDKKDEFKFDNYKQKINDIDNKSEEKENDVIPDGSKTTPSSNNTTKDKDVVEEPPLQAQLPEDGNEEKLDEISEKSINQKQSDDFVPTHEQKFDNEIPKEKLEPPTEYVVPEKPLNVELQNMQSSEQYNSEQYPQQDYQYQPGTDYQDQMYQQNYENQVQNYQGEEYQYDQNAYQYNYDQQGDQYVEYNANNQYSSDGQYTAENQYNPDNQYTSGDVYQDSNQQQYSEVAYGEQNFNDQSYEQAYEGDNNTQPAGYENTENMEGYLQQAEPQMEASSVDVINNENIEGGELISNNVPQSISEEKNHPQDNESNPIYSENNEKDLPVQENVSSVAEETKTPAPIVKPTSILATEKPSDQQNAPKKKKKVNFLDSDTEDSFTTLKMDPVSVKSDESDFDFSSN